MRGRNWLQLYSELSESANSLLFFLLHDLLCLIVMCLFDMGAFRLVSLSSLCSEHLSDSECLCLCRTAMRRLCASVLVSV